ncbi:unnamed protein product [Symbiodinium necroappetens]|uniref:Uncharacterized protein n=1 Tax=Symbiodinium necroappetens TaxID=1628268 RepID=A0A813CEC2_9DINO|nr:unnamed protein product [Symbiodinium necroappetens]
MALRRSSQFRPEDLPTPDRPRRLDHTQACMDKVEVHIPQYSSEERAPYIAASGSRTKELFRLWARTLTPEDMSYCKGMLQESRRLDGRYGSICSGMDIGAIVMKQFWEWARFKFELDASGFSHKFACEQDESKRSFLLATHPEIQNMFCDATELTADAKVLDTVTNTHVEVPLCTVLTAGFPCQDCSVLNPNSSSSANRSCVAAGTLRTGSVLQGIVRYLKTMGPKGPKFCFFENVAGLKAKAKDEQGNVGHSNLDHVGHLLDTETDRLLHVWELDPRMFGVPQSRKRLWMTAIPRRFFRGLVPEPEVHKMLNTIMNTLAGFTQAMLSQYLVEPRSLALTKFHTEYEKRLKQIQTRRARRRAAAQPSDLGANSQDTVANRRQSFASSYQSSRAGSTGRLSTCSSGTRLLKREKIVTKEWLKKFRRAARSRPYLKCMTARKRRTLFKLHVKDFPTEDTKVIDISQDKFAHSTSHSPCVTPKGERYLTSECRSMVPEESFRLQGAWLSSESLEQFPQSLLADLAGNAFEASCFAATFWATMVCYGRLHVLSQNNPSSHGVAVEPRRAPEVQALRTYDTPDFDSQVLLDFSDHEDSRVQME